MELKKREQVIKDLQEVVDNYSGSWKRFNVLDNALSLIKELTEENDRLQNISVGYRIERNTWKDLCDTIEADTVHKMQSMIKEECIAGGIYPAYVAGVVERVGENILEENNDN